MQVIEQISITDDVTIKRLVRSKDDDQFDSLFLVESGIDVRSFLPDDAWLMLAWARRAVEWGAK